MRSAGLLFTVIFIKVPYCILLTYKTSVFHSFGIDPSNNPILIPTLVGPVKNHWELAGAVRANSRDLGYAVGDVLTAMVKDGRLKAICEKYGVSFTPPDL